MKKQIYGIFYYSIKSSYTASVPPTLLKLSILFIKFNFVSQNIYFNRVKSKPTILSVWNYIVNYIVIILAVSVLFLRDGTLDILACKTSKHESVVFKG